MEMTVTQAAETLHISPARVRQLISNGALPAKKIGASWILREEDVLDRLSKAPEAGRPKKPLSCGLEQDETLDLSDFRLLYERCKKDLTEPMRLPLVKFARTSEEAAFYMAMADFFLQQKQAELVAKGVY